MNHHGSMTTTEFDTNRSNEKTSLLKSLNIEKDEIEAIDDRTNNIVDNYSNDNEINSVELLAGLAGNIIEWYDFAIFGYFSDVIGEVFFPPNHQDNNTSIIESFLVFGIAFLFRPVGALIFGYIGDTYNAKNALELSLFVMAIPTFAIGCLPTYNQVGYISVILLSCMRLLQGISLGGQLVSSVVFTLETRDKKQWGLYGSYVMISIEIGTLLGSVSGFIIRSIFNKEQIKTFGWRIPFLFGILLCIPGYYLKYHSTPSHQHPKPKNNPIIEAFQPKNIKFLISSTLVSMLGTSSFYLTFVWMAVYFNTMLHPPIKNAFLITTISLFLSCVIFTPIPGYLSDFYGRKHIMTPGAIGVIVLGPLTIYIACSTGSTLLAFLFQTALGASMCFWGSPMAAWMVESFPPEIRLTSVSIGYNIATCTVGGFCPAFATVMVDRFGIMSPGILYIVFAILSLIGLYTTPKINFDS